MKWFQAWRARRRLKMANEYGALLKEIKRLRAENATLEYDHKKWKVNRDLIGSHRLRAAYLRLRLGRTLSFDEGMELMNARH